MQEVLLLKQWDSHGKVACGTQSDGMQNNEEKEECTIPRFDIEDKLAVGLGTLVGPVLLEGWKIDSKGWNKNELMGDL